MQATVAGLITSGAIGADEALMLRYRDGDTAAFETLYHCHKDAMYRYLLRGCSNPDRAAELLQDVWASVIRSRATYKPRAKFTTWLYRLAHNRLVDEYRSAKPATAPLEDASPVAVPEHEQPEAQLQSGHRLRKILTALARLPLEQRQAFLMKEEGGLSLEEIAQAMGVGRETVKSRLRYALAKLREELADV